MNREIKILHTEWSDGWGGQEIRIIGEMIAIREQGVEVFLACRNHAIIKQKAKENNIKVFTLPFNGNSDLRTLFALKKIIKKYDINIVNTHSGKDTWVGGLAAKLSGVKFIRTRHLSNHIRSSRTNFINELADYIFTTGESVRMNMIRYNRIRPSKIQSIPTGIDTDVFNPDKYDIKQCRDKFHVEDNQIVIGIVAVLRRFKRHDRFLEMVSYIINHNPDKNIRVLIAGDGPQKEKLSSMIDDLNLKDKVTMLGHVQNIPELLKALDIFVLTSDSGEGVPQSVMQALLMKTAVVATNSGSTGDLHNEENFILVDRDNQDQLNDACNQLVSNASLREDYSKGSRNYVYNNYSALIMMKKIMKIYRYLS